MIKRNIPLIIFLVLLAAWAVFLEKTANVFVFGFQQDDYSRIPPFMEMTFPTQDNSQLVALYAPAQKGKPTFLVFHGNKQNIYTFQNLMLPYAQKGYGVFLFDYRGYGKSEGEASESNMKEDAQAALGYMMERMLISPQEIILWGFSLGSAPALELAAQRNDWPFKALVLQSPFTNTTDMAFFMLANRDKDRFFAPILSALLRPFLWDKQFDMTRPIGLVRAPLLIGHSAQDKVVPSFLTAALAAKAPKHAQVFASPDGEHDSPFWFEPAVMNFIKTLH